MKNEVKFEINGTTFVCDLDRMNKDKEYKFAKEKELRAWRPDYMPRLNRLMDIIDKIDPIV